MLIKGNIWGNIKKAVRSWRWWSDRVVNSNVKDLAVLPPLKLAFYTFIICEQTTLWLIGPNSDKFMTKWTFISQQRDPKWHIHSNGQLAWMDFSYSYILKWENAEIVKKYVGRFTTPLKDTQKDDKKALSNVLRAQNIYTEYIHFEWEDKKDLKEWKYKSKS